MTRDTHPATPLALGLSLLACGLGGCPGGSSSPAASEPRPTSQAQAEEAGGTDREGQPGDARGKRLPRFDARRAMAELVTLAEFGHRYYGAPRRAEALDRLERALRDAGAQVQRQTFAAQEGGSGERYALTNLIGRHAPDQRRRVLIGSHFDTRLWAEEDAEPEARARPIMGANDGTSGVAVVLEVLRAVAADPGWAGLGLDVVLFDGEEFGRPGNGDYCRGSIHFAKHIDVLYPEARPTAAIILDMVGDRDLRIPRERSSNAGASRWLNDLFFETGRRRAPGVFLQRVGSAITDDHSPLQKLGIPAILVIDLQYPHWHTQADTLDKVSAESLATVGSALIETLDALRRRKETTP